MRSIQTFKTVSYNKDSVFQCVKLVIYIQQDIDDVEEIQNLITAELKDAQDVLYDYPNLVTLFERSYLSITVLDGEQNIIGCAVFNDYPQGLTGQIDYKHENFWEEWLFKAFDFSSKQWIISSYNSLWLTYIFLAKEYYQIPDNQELNIYEKVFQNVYATLSHLEGIIFLKRGESLNQQFAQEEVNNLLRTFFWEIKSKDKENLRKVQGIHVSSQVFYSSKYTCNQQMEIRMAREQDHDDLAEIFNRQSEVLTSQFGEFFIADLIATQNQTRRISKKYLVDGKAIVGQVQNKAVGLMSVSMEIGYQLLGKCFELGTYDNLYKAEFMESIERRRQQIIQTQKYVLEDEEAKKQEQMKQERLKCHFIGQRMTLHQYFIDIENKVTMEIDEWINEIEKQKTLTPEKVQDMILSWIKDYKLHFPSDLFENSPYETLQTIILSPLEFFLETLQFFGLPAHYMDGNGHWKDWKKKKIEEAKALALRKPQKKKFAKVGRQKQENKEDEFQNPKWFDLAPLQMAFKNFVKVKPEDRAIFRTEIEQKQKQVVVLFCDDYGVEQKDMTVDLNDIGFKLKDQNLNVSEGVSETIAQFMECFAHIRYVEETIQVELKDEKKKKGEEVTIVDKVLKKVNYQQFNNAIKILGEFDKMLCRLKCIISETIKAEVQIEIERENKEKQLKLKKRKVFQDEPFEAVRELTDLETLPQPPLDQQNAIVINLFCIDEEFENRSLDFIEYAFSLFEDRDYIILTQPYNVQETTLLQHFIQVPMQKNSTFEHVLYIYHKDSLNVNSITIRKSNQEDIETAQLIIEPLLKSQIIYNDMIESITHTASKKVSFSIFCNNQLVGIYILSKNVNLDYYISHFCIQDHIILKEHDKTKHMKLLHSVLNPLLQKETRYILKEIMRLMDKTCLYFEVHERSLLPDIFNELLFIRARTFPHFIKQKWDFEHDYTHNERSGDRTEVQDGQRDPFDQEQSMFSLSLLTKKMLSAPKIQINTRIVVVGASDTGISFIESLLTIKEIDFTHITLLAPGGLLTMYAKEHKHLLKALSTNYTLEELRNLMLDARVNVLDSKMVKLDKKNKKIHLDKGAILPYDILVITVGLIDQELQSMDPPLISCGLIQSDYYKKKEYIKGVYSIDDPYLYKDFIPSNDKENNIQLLTRKKKPQNVVIYGRNLHTIAFIQGLINRGVNPERITLVIPQIQRIKKVDFSSADERLEYETQCINDPDPFDDDVIHRKIFDEFFKNTEINIHYDYNLYRIDTDTDSNTKEKTCKNVVIRKQAEDYEDTMKMIQDKQKEIQEQKEEGDDNSFDRGDNYSDGSEEQNKKTPQQEIADLEAKLYDEKNLEARILLTSGLVDIDNEIFQIIHDNGLVYNGRLIIKSNFQTTENDIFCCGKICEFSQRYKNLSVGKSLRLDKYNSRELGQKLSKCILEHLDLSYLTRQLYSEDELPSLYMPVGQGAFLLNNFYYYSIKKNDWALPNSTFSMPKSRKDIQSDNITDKEGFYLKLCFDNNGLIDSVSYLGSKQVSVTALISFVGLSESYLNQLNIRHESGLIPNLCEWLSENWSMCLYHEWFSEFRHITKISILESENMQQILEKATKLAAEGAYIEETFFQDELKQSKIDPEVVKTIQDGTVDFLRQNANHLPMYYIPQKKVEMQEDPK